MPSKHSAYQVILQPCCCGHPHTATSSSVANDFHLVLAHKWFKVELPWLNINNKSASFHLCHKGSRTDLGVKLTLQKHSLGSVYESCCQCPALLWVDTWWQNTGNTRELSSLSPCWGDQWIGAKRHILAPGLWSWVKSSPKLGIYSLMIHLYEAINPHYC